MHKKKRNHWVPQSYLRGFAADPDSRRKIWRFSKIDGAPELKAIERVAVGFYLYAPRNADGIRDYTFENRLAELEQWFADPVWVKLCNDMVDLRWEPLRKMTALLVAVMYLRNPKQLEQTKFFHKQFVDWLSQFPELPTSFELKGKVYAIDPSTWPSYRDASEDDQKRLWIDNVSSAVWLAEILMKMRWAVIVSETPVFITTDNPVAILHPSLKFRGLNDPDTSIMFPLSPTRILSMDNRHDQPDARYYPLKHNPASWNTLLWRNAIDHLFSSRHPDIVCAEMMSDAERMSFV